MKYRIVPKKGEIFDTKFFILIIARLQSWDFGGAFEFS
jgi:hypothetical protein